MKLKLFHNIFASGIAEERLYKSTNNASIHWIQDGQQNAEFSYNLKWFVMVRGKRDHLSMIDIRKRVKTARRSENQTDQWQSNKLSTRGRTQ